MKVRFILALVALSAAALVPGANASGPQTTVPDVFLNVHVTITDSRITLDRHSATRGDEVRFILRNSGTKVHSFTLGTTTKRGAGNQTGFSSVLKPKAQKLILLFLDYRGPLPYRSILKHDQGKPGMKGIFTIR
jgi:hypothetical protein